MFDSLGDRMKNSYENRTRYHLPRRTYTIIRVDGKAFHTLTRNCVRPFDDFFMSCMQTTALRMCEQIQGSCFAFVQSDEISILITDFEKETTDAWFDGNLQKICSISAAIATLEFNKEWRWSAYNSKDGLFDSRVFTIPDRTEVMNYFIWRQQDATRNSIQMLAQSHFSHKELHKKNQSDMHEMLHKIGINWNDLRDDMKRGAVIFRGKENWEVMIPPVFTQDRLFLDVLIPNYHFAMLSR